MGLLGSLTELRILKVRGKAISGLLSTIDLICDERSFQKLEVFKMAYLDVSEWYMGQGAMPKLQSLVIESCEAIRMLPDELRCLSALRDVEVLHPNPILAERLRQLRMRDGYIAFAVSMVSCFQSNPGKLHWMAIQWIFRYLKRNKGRKLTYHGSDDLKLSRFSDFDYQGCLDSRKSPSGFVFMLCGGAIAWKSKKQECVAQSTMEAEYIALNAAAKEAVYLKQFLTELLIVECV
uniref:Uncharacterized protein n=1 Tax=Quercus lobata TaxID=97700 RepID=A0A7N2MYJ8_QUELO